MARTPARGGRPRKAQDESRSEYIRARVRRDEMVAIETRAAEANRHLSDYLRSSALGSPIAVRGGTLLSVRERHDMARIGSNLNQIARSMNMNPDLVDPRRAARVTDELTELLTALRALLGRLHELE